MILTPRQLKHFENFKCDEAVRKQDKSYHTSMYDEVVLTFIEDVPKLFGGTKERTWTKSYSFKRHEQDSDKEGYSSHTMSNDYQTLKKQLEDIVLNKWNYISEENLEYFTETYPQRFI